MSLDEVNVVQYKRQGYHHFKKIDSRWCRLHHLIPCMDCGTLCSKKQRQTYMTPFELEENRFLQISPAFKLTGAVQGRCVYCFSIVRMISLLDRSKFEHITIHEAERPE